MGNKIEITGEENKKEDEIEFLDLHFLIFVLKKNYKVHLTKEEFVT